MIHRIKDMNGTGPSGGNNSCAKFPFKKIINTGAVQWIASQMGFSELASYLENGNTTEYAHFILTGEG